MAELRYDISVLGDDKLKRAIRSIDSELVAHQRRTARIAGGGTSRRATGGARSLEAERRRDLRESFRGFEEIGKVAAREEVKRHRQALANIEKEKRARIRAEEQAAKKAHQEQIRSARIAQQARARFAGGVVTSAGNAAAGIIRTGAGLAGVGGTALAVNAVSERARVQGAIAQLANQGFGEGGPSRQVLARNIDAAVTSTASASGRSDSDVTDMMRSFVDISGDLQGAMKLLPRMAEIADASGAEGSDIGRSLATVLEGVKLKGGKGLSNADAEKRALTALRVMAGQGKIGSIELSDQANVGAARTVAAATQFGGDFEKNMATLGGLAQMAVGKGGGASSPDEAFMAISRISSDALKHEKQLRKLGVDVFTDKSRTQLRSPDAILFEAIHRSKGDLSKLDPIFNERSTRAMNPLAQMYTEAGGGEAGLDAMRKQLAAFQRAGMSEGEVKESAAFRRSQDDRQFKKTWDDFNRMLGKELLPVAQDAIPELAKAIPTLAKGITAMAKLMQWFIENPIKGIGGIIVASVVADIAKAKIGETLSGALTRMISGRGASAVPTGGAGALTGGPPNLKAAGATAAVAASAWLVDDQLTKFDKVTGYKGRGINPLADDSGKMDSDTILGGLTTLNPFDEDSFGGRIGRGIGGRIQAARAYMNEPIATPKSGAEYDKFMAEARAAGKLDAPDKPDSEGTKSAVSDVNKALADLASNLRNFKPETGSGSDRSGRPVSGPIQ